jgi:cytochrome b561
MTLQIDNTNMSKQSSSKQRSSSRHSSSQNTSKWRDSHSHYGRISRLLHWFTAVLVIFQIVIVVLWQNTGKNAVTLFLESIGPHGSLGFLILIVTAIRVGWAWINRKQRPPQAQGLGGVLARLMHRTFYVLLLWLPAFALLRQYGEGHEIRLYSMIIIPEAERHIGWIVAPAELLHGYLSWLLCGLVIGHIAMALIHRFWLKDKILARMAG